MICLLDLDGTLIDSADRHRLLMGQLLKQYCPKQAGDFDPAGYMAYKADGHSGKQYLTEILHLDKEKAKEIQERWQAQIEEETYLDTDELYADVIPFLEHLRGSAQDRTGDGADIVYLTARQNRQGLLAELKRLGILEYASEVIIVDPANAMVEKIRAAREIREKDPQVILVGDTENEYAVAKELQLPVYLLHRGFRSRAYWAARGVTTYAGLNEIDL